MIENLEEYVKKVLKIPYCNFEGVDSRIAYEIVVGLSLMYEMYPFFNRVICSIVNPEELQNHVNLLNYSNNNIENVDYYKFEDCKTSPYGIRIPLEPNWKEFKYKLPKLINKKFADYFALIIYNTTKNFNFSKYDIKNTTFGRIGMYHEFGHILDVFLHVSSSDKLKDIITGHDIEKEISEYACTNNIELVAEAFGRYIFSQSKTTKLEQRIGQEFKSNYKCTSVVEEIGKLIDEEYKKFTKFRQIKFINERYNFNKKFTIMKNDITKKEIVELEESFKTL